MNTSVETGRDVPADRRAIHAQAFADRAFAASMWRHAGVALVPIGMLSLYVLRTEDAASTWFALTGIGILSFTAVHAYRGSDRARVVPGAATVAIALVFLFRSELLRPYDRARLFGTYFLPVFGLILGTGLLMPRARARFDEVRAARARIRGGGRR